MCGSIHVTIGSTHIYILMVLRDIKKYANVQISDLLAWEY